MQDKPVTLAAITGAHGVTGEVRLKLFGEGLATLQPGMQFNDGALTLKKVRGDNKGGAIARFAEIADRTAAERLRGTTLSVPRSVLPALDEGEFYHADLIGLCVKTDAGNPVGRVIAVENFGATDIIEIERDPVPEKGMKTFMVPIIGPAVLEWDDANLVIARSFAE